MTVPISNPQAVGFADNYARTAADRLAQAYFFAKAALAEWNQVSGLFPNDATVVQDGAAPNGVDATGGDRRLVVTGAKVTNVVTRLQEFVTDYEAGASAKLNTVMAVAVNPTRIG